MESAAYEGGGAGGKLRRRPVRRATSPTPYDRAPTAARGGLGGIRNGWLSRLVDPASRIITGGASRLFSSVLRKALPVATAPLQSSGVFSLLTTGRVSSPVIPMKWNERKPSISPLFLFCRRSSFCSYHLREAYSYSHSYAKVSFLSSLPFCDQSFSQNNLDLLHKESSLSRRWCHTSKSHTQCWSCGNEATSWPFLVCEACRSVQPMDPSVDYFQIFGLERTYEIKDNNLEGKYKDWQKKLHPDLVHSKSEEERAFAAEQSARVIDAYRTLSKPLSRALYLLQLEGMHVDEEKTLTDPDILAEMMEIREAVEEAGDSDTLKQIQSQIQTKLHNWSGAFREAFEKQNFEDAINSVQRMRYYDRAIEAIVKKL